MIDARPVQARKAARQAAIWSARLRRTRVTLDELRGFYEWRREPENRAAFDVTP